MTTTEIVQRAVSRRAERTTDAIADLTEGRNTVKEIAHRLKIKPKSVSEMRRRFERATGVTLARHEARGRKPAPLN